MKVLLQMHVQNVLVKFVEILIKYVARLVFKIAKKTALFILCRWKETQSSGSAAAAEKRLDACGRILYSYKINCGAIFRRLVKECLLSRSRIPDDEKVTWIMKK